MALPRTRLRASHQRHASFDFHDALPALDVNRHLIRCQLSSNCQPVFCRHPSMRKSREETARTRARIVAAAGQEFRRSGIAATGLAGLRNAAGLTHGGFYKHFSSKDELVAQACGDAINGVLDALVERAPRSRLNNGCAPSWRPICRPRIATCPRTARAAGGPGSELGRAGQQPRARPPPGDSNPWRTSSCSTCRRLAPARARARTIVAAAGRRRGHGARHQRSRTVRPDAG